MEVESTHVGNVKEMGDKWNVLCTRCRLWKRDITSSCTAITESENFWDEKNR